MGRAFQKLLLFLIHSNNSLFFLTTDLISFIKVSIQKFTHMKEHWMGESIMFSLHQNLDISKHSRKGCEKRFIAGFKLNRFRNYRFDLINQRVNFTFHTCEKDLVPTFFHFLIKIPLFRKLISVPLIWINHEL